jgi:phosphatidylinositol-3-phosphatase
MAGVRRGRSAGLALLLVVALCLVVPRPPAARAATGPACAGAPPQRITHVVVVVMENHGYSAVIGSPDAPYLNSLAGHCGLATAYRANAHPSLPNYLAMTGGSTFGITDDADPSVHRLAAASVFQQLGTGWRAYEESMATRCQRTSAGRYAVRHNPAAYYTPIASECVAQDVPLPAAPAFDAALTFVTPNLVDDMHDGTVADGDRWLAGFVPKVLASPQYLAGTLALFVVWDENGGTDAGPSNHVPCLVVAPSVPAGARLALPVSHFSLLATVEDLLGLPRLGAAATSTSLDSLLQHRPPGRIFTTIAPLLEIRPTDQVVRAHLMHGTTSSYGTWPLSGGILDLWMHHAGTTRWTYAGSAVSGPDGWTYRVEQQRWWTAYRWTFSGNLRFYGTTSTVVAG